MNILIVEDMRDQREALKKIIEEEFKNITIYLAPSLETALKIANIQNIDLFMFDVNLQGRTGIELAEKIRCNNKYKLTPIVFITIESGKMIDAFKNIHCYDFIIKPYRKEEIKKIINTFLEAQSVSEKMHNKYTFFNISPLISVKIYHKDIIFIEYYLRKCTIYTIKDKYDVKVRGLNNLIKEIDSEYIVQSHKSYAINLNYIEKIEKVYPKLWNIYFTNCSEIAKLGYKYKNNIYEKVK